MRLVEMAGTKATAPEKKAAALSQELSNSGRGITATAHMSTPKLRGAEKSSLQAGPKLNSGARSSLMPNANIKRRPWSATEQASGGRPPGRERHSLNGYGTITQ